MAKIYFEEKGESLLKRIGMTKAEFARKMGIRKQNVNVLFKSKNLETIHRAAEVMGVPFELLIGYTSDPLKDGPPENIHPAEDQILENDIPTGNSTENRKARQKVIFDYYQQWKTDNPSQKKYNLYLQDYINIRAISLDETAAHASRSYLSTLAILQLDAILTNAWVVKTMPSKSNSKNQRAFESIMHMEYVCTGVGRVKMTVGIRRSDKMKIQYCITAIDTLKIKREDE